MVVFMKHINDLVNNFTLRIHVANNNYFLELLLL